MIALIRSGFVTGVLALMLALSGAAFGAADSTAIRAAIDAPDRLATDRVDDARRKPQLVLEFLGARPGMHVLDVFAGSGYYAELLTHIVGPTGLASSPTTTRPTSRRPRRASSRATRTGGCRASSVSPWTWTT